ncbi:MAG TPA: hypothetical protein VFC63_19305 [Blastocatellia bacterium]|nr:hypothetical protein [Blastocatellia bacterium]
MAEEAMNPAQATGETVTPASGNEGQNNTSTASEGANTQRTGRTAQDRIQELVKERDEWKAKAVGSQSADNQSQTSAQDAGDLVLDLIGKVPEHLKPEMKNIANYAKKHSMPIDDVITLWDARDKISPEDVAAKAAADQAANNSRTGGTPNPAARQETPEVSKMSTQDLRGELEKRVASGEKL